MRGRTRVAGELLGCRVIDVGGRRLGRVIAVIHKAHGADVLIEGRRWFFQRHSRRVELDDIVLMAPGLAAMLERDEVSVPRETVAAAEVGAPRTW